MWEIDENGNANGDNDCAFEVWEKYGVRELYGIPGHRLWIERDIAIFNTKAEAQAYIKWLVNERSKEE